MTARPLPGTDLALTPVGLGCWALGGLWWGKPVDEATAIDTVCAAIDCGINWVDTAPLYGHGRADELLVRALGRRLRDIVVATKVGVRWDGSGAHARSDLRPAYVVADVEASLRRLNLDRIDLLQVHWPCESGTPIADTVAALVQMQAAGKVRHFGVCNYDAPGLCDVAAAGPVAVLQTPYSLLRREFEGALLASTRALPGRSDPLGVVVYEPLCRGLLTGKFNATARFGDDDLRARDDRFAGPRFLRALTVTSRLQLVARRLGVPVAALAIAWTARRPGITAAIAGAKSRDQVACNAQAMALCDRDDLPWAEIDRIADSYRG
ncbi:MAG: aldo/keto reductase [Deltaproteobacteria bacterium]|nr:aldo/keto reductase [Deltaproteobacteria bacterium]